MGKATKNNQELEELKKEFVDRVFQKMGAENMGPYAVIEIGKDAPFGNHPAVTLTQRFKAVCKETGFELGDALLAKLFALANEDHGEKKIPGPETIVHLSDNQKSWMLTHMQITEFAKMLFEERLAAYLDEQDEDLAPTDEPGQDSAPSLEL